MSRNYNHSRLSRNSIGRKKSTRGSFKMYLLLIIIIMVAIFLARDVIPTNMIIEENITNQVKAGEFNK